MDLRTLLRVLIIVTSGVACEDVRVPRDLLLRLQSPGQRWTCHNNLDHRTRVANPGAVGPCETALKVIYFPNNFRDRIILTAECDPNCSINGPSFYKCENEIREVPVIDPMGSPLLYYIPVGCLCSKVPSAKGQPGFTVVGSHY